MADHPVMAAPRELSAEEAQERGEWAFGVHQRIVTAIRDGRAAMWRLAEALYDFDEDAGWTALGYDRLADYLADPEVSMRQSTYYHAVARWRKLVVRRRVDSERLENLDPSKVEIVMSAIESNTVKLDDALSDVEELGARDLREKYYGRREQLPKPSDGELDDLNDEAVEEDDLDAAEGVEPGDDAEAEPNLPRSTGTPTSVQLPETVGLCPGHHTQEFYVPDPQVDALCPACSETLVQYTQVR